MANVAPTKTNLLRLRHELEFARLGHELLDQKRNILVIELLNLVDQAVDFQERVVKALEEAYRTLEEAVLRMGKLRVSHLASAVNIRAEIELKTRRVMGVRLPVVETTFAEHPPYYSPLGTSFWIDNSLDEFKEALQVMGRLAELKISIIRLAAEVRKTIRNKGHFPSDDAAVKLIYLSLRQIEAKWKRPPREWQAAKSQLAIQFGERFTLED